MGSRRGGPVSAAAAVRAVVAVLLTLTLAACGSAGEGGLDGDGNGGETRGQYGGGEGDGNGGEKGDGSRDEKGGDGNRGGATASPSPRPSVPPPPGGPAPPGPPAPDVPSAEQDGEVLAWLPVGPAAPSDPAWEFMYGLASRAQCDALAANAENEPSGSIWHATATLCVAMTTGDEEAWRTGTEQLEQSAPAPDHCLMQALSAALRRLVAYHAAHPDSPIVPRSTPGGTACTIGLTGVAEGVQPGADPDASTDLCGGREFRLIGRLVDVTHVTVDGARVEVRREDENVYLFAAPAGPAGVVTIVAHGASGPLPGSAKLRYVDSGFPCTPPATDDGAGTESTPPPVPPAPGDTGTLEPGQSDVPDPGESGSGGAGTDAS